MKKPATITTTIRARTARPVQRSTLPAVIRIPEFPAGRLKRLAQSHEELRRTESRHRVQVMANVKADRPNGSVVPDSKTYRVREIVNKGSEIERAVNVATVVKGGGTQVFHDVS